MFEEKVVGALHSPALMTDLRHYQRVLSHDASRRGWLVILSLCFVVLLYIPPFITPSATVTTDASDIISGGIATRQDALVAFDNKKSTFSQLASALHLTRNDLTSVSPASDNNDSNDLMVEWTSIPTYHSPYNPETSPSPTFSLFPTVSNGLVFFGYRINPLSHISDKSDSLLIGQSKAAGQFGVVKQTGTILTHWDYSQQIDTCYKNPNESLSYLYCPNGSNLRTTTEIYNLSRHNDARYVNSRAGERLEYVVTLHNNYPYPIQVSPQIYLGDVLEYAHLDHNHTGTFNPHSQILSWGKVIISPGSDNKHSFIIQILQPLPLTATNPHNRNSYDCRLTTFFGGSRTSPLVCSTPKVAEKFLQQPLGQGFWLLAWSLLIFNTFLYVRSRILVRELKLVLHTLRKVSH